MTSSSPLPGTLPPNSAADQHTLASLLAALRDARFSKGIRCPRCGHGRYHLWGTFSGRQRYRCLGCRRTFSDLTGTPAAYLKKIQLLPAYGRCWAAAESVRRTATRLDIHPSTAFRWRHRLCAWLEEHDGENLTGWVELDSFFLLDSQKGQRNLQRPPRRRGPEHTLLFDEPRVRVTLACDRTGQVVSGAVPARRPPAAAFQQVLQGRLIGETHLVARNLSGPLNLAHLGQFTFHRASGQPLRIDDSSINLRSPPTLAHGRTVFDYRSRLRRWLAGFRGVATKYLLNYLIWHRTVDAAHRFAAEALVLRWTLGAGDAEASPGGFSS